MKKRNKTKQEKREELIRYLLFYGGLGLLYLYRYEVTDIFNFTVAKLRNLDPVVVNSLNNLKDGIVIYLHAFSALLTLRLLIMWLPNLNPFIQPYYIVRVLTEPPMEWIRKRLPTLLGLDLSFLVLSYLISYAIKYLTIFKF